MSRPSSPAPALTPRQLAERDRRVLQYRYLVLITIRRMNLPDMPGFEFEDRMSIGYLALLDAAETYDPARSQFVTHAVHKIRHALLDAQRQWRPGKRNHHHRVHVTSLHNPIMSSEREGVSLADALPGDEDIEQELVQKLAGERLQQALARLPERELRVIRLYYGQEWTFKAIGEALGVSESRTYQLHRQALERMKTYLGEDA